MGTSGSGPGLTLDVCQVVNSDSTLLIHKNLSDDSASRRRVKFHKKCRCWQENLYWLVFFPLVSWEILVYLATKAYTP